MQFIFTLNDSLTGLTTAYLIITTHSLQAGAIYFLCKLPSHLSDDVAFVKRMAKDFGVAVVPGSSGGTPGCVRVSYANNRPEDCPVVIDRLDRALGQLCVENS